MLLKIYTLVKANTDQATVLYPQGLFLGEGECKRCGCYLVLCSDAWAEEPSCPSWVSQLVLVWVLPFSPHVGMGVPTRPSPARWGCIKLGLCTPIFSGPIPPLPILILGSCALWVALGVSTQVTIALTARREHSSSVPDWGRTGRLPFPLKMLHLLKKKHLPQRSGNLEQINFSGKQERNLELWCAALCPERAGRTQG